MARSIGYYGGISLAIAPGYIEASLGIFLAAIPFFKMLNRPQAAASLRFIAQILEGAAKPVGGDSSATLELTTPDVPLSVPISTFKKHARSQIRYAVQSHLRTSAITH